MMSGSHSRECSEGRRTIILHGVEAQRKRLEKVAGIRSDVRWAAENTMGLAPESICMQAQGPSSRGFQKSGPMNSSLTAMKS